MILKLFLFEVFETKCSSNLWKNIVCYVTNILIFNHVYLNSEWFDWFEISICCDFS